jgi:hypothetical protein
MINIKIKIEAVANFFQRTLIRWDNPIAISDGYCTDARRVNGELIGQFSMAPLYITHPDGEWVKSWAENSLATRLTPADLLKIASMQIADTYSVEQKMGWLCAASLSNGWGSPINTKGEDYTVATDIRMITAVYAGQPVELTGESMTRTFDLNGNIKQELLWRVSARPPAAWTRANCQTVTAVSKNNVYTTNTKGHIVLPLYYGDRKAYVLDRWLVPLATIESTVHL